jgi:CubicO group peptidase (beta-lactamase class C family)
MILALLFACVAPAEKSPQSEASDLPPGGDDTAPDPSDDTADSADPADPRAEAVRAAVEAALGRGRASGASVAIWHRGEIVFAEGFGSAHPDEDRPVGVDTLFAIGSDTKKITAIALLQLADEGAVDLDAPLSAAMPDLSLAQSPGWAAAVTPRQLIAHQGGLWDYTPWDDAPADAELRDRAYGEFAGRIWQQSPPGAFFNYSNPNFSVAGLLTEQLAGQPWADQVRAAVLEPLGLRRTFTRQAEAEADGDFAVGDGYALAADWDAADPFLPYSDEAAGAYTVGTVEMADSSDNGFTRPAGMLWSNATDMALLGAFLVNGDPAVLSEASRAALTTAAMPLYPSIPAEDLTGYGYGLFVGHRLNLESGAYDVALWSHGGNTLCQTSTFYVLPDQQLVIAILSNGYGDDMVGPAVAAMEAYAGEELGEPIAGASYPTEQDPLETYAGTYVDAWLGEITVTTDGVDLFVSIPAAAAAGITVRPKLTPALTDVWTVRFGGGDAEFTFVDGEDGTPNRYVRSRGFVGTRVDEAPPALPTPPAAELRRRLLGPALDGAVPALMRPAALRAALP